ncbi:MAG: VCBS repeat-containing protein [Planctomycetes bacterium]|nr:VCBS repeat-containing protein [Planctomycetota bacterium]
MRLTRSLLALTVFVLPAATCSPVLTLFDVPATVQAGHEFAVSVWGTDTVSTSGGTVGCVLQLPLGLSITSHVVVQTGSSIVVRDDPTLLSQFTVEPGHYLASFHGYNQNLGAGIAVRMLAPASLPPGSRLKVAIVTQVGGAWSTPQTNFALIGGNQSRPIALVSDPPTMVEAQGLPVLDHVVAGDVDGDGIDELLGLDNGGTNFWTCCWNGASWTATMFPLPTTILNWSCVPGDFDGDGNLDVALCGEVLFGDGLGGWTLGPTLPTGSGVTHVAVGDIDADGLPDIAVTSANGSALVHRSNGDRTFSSWSSGLPTPVPSSSFADQPLLADVTGDGFADLIVQHVFFGGQGLEVWASDGLGGWTMAGLLQPRYRGQFAVGSLSPGASPSVIAVDANSSQPGIRMFSHQGSGTWTSTLYPLGSYADGILLVDFDGDGTSDLLLHESGPNATQLGPGLRLFYTSPGPMFVADTYSGLTGFGLGLQLTSGDFDGDGWPDVAGADNVHSGAFAWLSTRLGAHAFGRGCGAGPIAPTIAAIGAPQLGNPASAVQLAALQPNTWSLLWLGFDNHLATGSIPLPLALGAWGAPDCALLADPLLPRVLFVGASGTATWPVPLPGNPTFHRLSVFAQGATLAPGANPLGMLFSGGLAIRLD